MHEFVARFRPFFLSAALFSLLINLLMLMPALFMLQVYDRVVTSRSLETLIMLTLLTAVALLFMSYLDVVRARLLGGAGVALEKLLGPRVLADMIRRSTVPGGRESLNGLRDVGLVRAFLVGPGVVALLDAPWVPLYVIIIFLFHPFLGIIALGGALVLLCLAYLNEKLSREPLQAMQLESRKAGRFADHCVSNAEVAVAMGMTDNVARGWHGLSRGVLGRQLEASRAASLLTSVTRFMRQFLQIGMLGAGALLVIEQASTPGIMIAATILLGRALAPVESAIAGWKALVDARGAYARLKKILEGEPSNALATALHAPKGALGLEGVVFGFRSQDRPVIRQASFELAAGELLVIVGPSAAGKSTLARLIVGVWKPVAGTVRIDGADIAQWPRERLGPYIGYLPQDVELFAGTVSENIARLSEVDSEAVIEAATRANAHEMILRLPQGYDTPIGESGAFLSAGQRQRVALARALYGSPRLVVLDEPNSNLDVEGEGALIEALQGLKREGVTAVIVTHRTPFLAIADKVLVLREGVMDKFGTPIEVGAPVRPIVPKEPTPVAAVIAGHIAPRG